MLTARTLVLALLAALLALAGGAGAAEARARSSSEFLQLLRAATDGCSGNATIQLATAVALSKSTVDAFGLALPLAVPYGCTLMLVGEGDALQELELGASSDAGIPQKLLFLQAGSTVILQRLSLTGVASPAVGKVGLPSGIDAFPGFLAIGGEPGSSVRSSCLSTVISEAFHLRGCCMAEHAPAAGRRPALYFPPSCVAATCTVLTCTPPSSS
jgi:hypothetical protein